MDVKITKDMAEAIENILSHGSRVELAVEKGKVAIVEIKRKLKYKEA